jgi:hypothetical protein
MIGDEKVRTGVTADADWNTTSKRWDNNTVYVRISLSLIGQNFRKYGYVIVVGSQDEYGPGKWRAVNAQKERWRFGGGTDGDVDSNIIDMIVPKGTTQENMLAYDAGSGKKALLAGILLPEKAQPENNQTENNTTVEAATYPWADFLPAIFGCGVIAICLSTEFVLKRRASRARLKASTIVGSRLKQGAEREDIERELLERLLAEEITESTYNEGLKLLEERK